MLAAQARAADHHPVSAGWELDVEPRMFTCVAEASAVEDAGMAAQDNLQRTGPNLERTGPLKLSHEISPTGETVVKLAGELDIASAEAAVSYITDILDRHGGPVIVDLNALAFCDARGLAALVRMAGYAEQRGCPFRLASPTPSLVKIMRITGLDRRFFPSQAPPPHR
jgi:anti-sigma B factor antagonist